MMIRFQEIRVILSLALDAGWEMTSRSLNHKYLCAAFAWGACIVALSIALGWCPSCADGPSWDRAFVQWVATAGATVSLPIGLLSMSRSETVERWVAALFSLVILLGAWLISLGRSAEISPCGLCYLFWAFVGFGFVVFTLARPRWSRVGAGTAVVAFATIYAAYASSDFRLALTSVAPKTIPAQYGPQIGETLPKDASRLKSGLVVMVPNCLPCARTSVERFLPSLQGQGHDVLVLISSEATWAPTVHEVTIQRVSSRFFADARMKPDGAPLVALVKSGKVVKVGSLSQFRIPEVTE